MTMHLATLMRQPFILPLSTLPKCNGSLIATKVITYKGKNKRLKHFFPRLWSSAARSTKAQQHLHLTGFILLGHIKGKLSSTACQKEFWSSLGGNQLKDREERSLKGPIEVLGVSRTWGTNWRQAGSATLYGINRLTDGTFDAPRSTVQQSRLTRASDLSFWSSPIPWGHSWTSMIAHPSS